MEKKQIIPFIPSFLIIFIQTLLIIIEKSKFSNIPIHYNLKGEITQYGNFTDIILMLLVSLLLNIFIFYLSFHPHRLNFPIEITEENKNQLYERMRFFLSILSFIVSIVFFLITLQSLNYFQNQSFIPYVLVLSFGLPFILLYIFKK